jgi:hypothetical protein
MRRLRFLIAIPAIAGLAIMGATAASAAPAHQTVRMVSSLADIPSAGAAKMVGGKLELPAQTAADCAVVYIIGSSADLYLNAEGLNEPVAATSGHGDCWSTANSGFGEFIYSGSGRCLADNASIGRVVMQNCTGALWQEWDAVPAYEYAPDAPGTVYVNDWTDLYTHTAGFLATNTLTSGTYVYATGNYADQWTEWYR